VNLFLAVRLRVSLNTTSSLHWPHGRCGLQELALTCHHWRVELAFSRRQAIAHLRVRLTSLASLEGKSVTSVCVLLLVSISRVEFLFLMEPAASNLASGMHPVHPFLKPEDSSVAWRGDTVRAKGLGVSSLPSETPMLSNFH
jgi:hypothetical protein